MYQYNQFDKHFVANRAKQFRSQVMRRLDGSLSEEEFRPLRLMNGLYLQLHAYMLRVAIPYGSLNSKQMHQLAYIAKKYDKDYAHFTTRQNIQYNWPKLKDVPDILDDLAQVDMHAIQTSGNCIRNVTSDHFAGASIDEIADPRPSAELLRQYSTDHPQFQFLPRKFKIAISGSPNDRAVIKSHDIGLLMKKDERGNLGYEIYIGGGLGRSPFVGKLLKDFLPKADLLPYIEAIMVVYNLNGRRDNKYKARIKILVHESGIEKIKQEVEEHFIEQKQNFKQPSDKLISAINERFKLPNFKQANIDNYEIELKQNAQFSSFVKNNISEHKNKDYSIISVSLKNIGETPGDATSDQMQILANLAKQYSHDELRISHEQNIILPHVHKSDLPEVFKELQKANLATNNIGLISDIIACPGMDYCALATARSIPVAKQIAKHFNELNLEEEIGQLKLKISGCINACGHHHVGHIGILGLEKQGKESYQITLGGEENLSMNIGKRAGPGFSSDELLPAIKRLIEAYLNLRQNPEESFLASYKRLGEKPFINALYPKEEKANVA
ncbi:MAG: nitrite/sulfite reductase [Devosiaceae bacterium]|nr:nitrite/sulfite reductase [Devosiaceae bacterium]